MFGTLSEEIVVNVPASEAWNLCGTLELSNLIQETLSNVVVKINVVEGDGGVGTVLEMFMRTGTEEGAILTYKEKFTVIDNEKRLKEVEMVEGGFLNLGFALYRIRLEITEKGDCKEQCIIKSTIEYEVKEEAASNASLIQIDHLVSVMHVAKVRLEKNYNQGK